jgi:hypothetical protein
MPKTITITMDALGQVSGDFDPSLDTQEIVWMLRIAEENASRIINQGFIQAQEDLRNDAQESTGESNEGKPGRGEAEGTPV